MCVLDYPTIFTLNINVLIPQNLTKNAVVCIDICVIAMVLINFTQKLIVLESVLFQFNVISNVWIAHNILIGNSHSMLYIHLHPFNLNMFVFLVLLAVSLLLNSMLI